MIRSLPRVLFALALNAFWLTLFWLGALTSLADTLRAARRRDRTDRR